MMYFELYRLKKKFIKLLKKKPIKKRTRFEKKN